MRAILTLLLLPSLALGISLQKKQALFSGLVATLLLQAKAMGYETSLGEAWRSPEQALFKAKLNELNGIGISNSLHTLRLAIDINLFRNGKFLTNTQDYAPLGAWWEKQCALCRWGGRFKRPDGNHFSLEHEGVK